MKKNHSVNPTDKSMAMTVKTLGARSRIGLIVGALVAFGVPMGAGAFVDERSAPAQSAPPAPGAAERAAQASLADAIELPKAVFATGPAPSSSAGAVYGDLDSPTWQGAYPGPYGQMSLADALIAQIVPVVGGAITLNGPDDALSIPVAVPSGANRLTTLRAMADAHHLKLTIKGSTVSIAKAGIGSASPAPSAAPPAPPAPPAPGGEPVPVLSASTVIDGTAVAMVDTPAGPPTKQWIIPKGTMLSTAMLDWAGQWGWELVWKADVDYRIAANITMQETFLDGVGKVLEAYRSGERPLWGDWNAEQRVLVVREPNNSR